MRRGCGNWLIGRACLTVRRRWQTIYNEACDLYLKLSLKAALMAPYNARQETVWSNIFYKKPERNRAREKVRQLELYFVLWYTVLQYCYGKQCYYVSTLIYLYCIHFFHSKGGNQLNVTEIQRFLHSIEATRSVFFLQPQLVSRWQHKRLPLRLKRKDFWRHFLFVGCY